MFYFLFWLFCSYSPSIYGRHCVHNYYK